MDNVDDLNPEPVEPPETMEPMEPMEPTETLESVKPVEEEPAGEGSHVALLPTPAETPAGDESQEGPPRPSVTFMGNNVDLASLGALASALLMIFICLTCNMGIYCLPVVPLALGLVGLFMASRSVDVRRTRLWSWIGVGTGTIMVILLLIGILLYVGLIWLMLQYSPDTGIIQTLNTLGL